MVVLSVAVTTKAGKPLLARMYVPLNRARAESLLASFPKLIGSESQHTFVETEQVRYVYQGVEQLYLVLITNKTSNIMEDLDTLRLFVKLIPEHCHGQTEDAVKKNAFSLIMAFDEVLNLGYKEAVTSQQIKTFTEMDSHEEKLQKIITESKISEAREAARKKAQAIESQKAELKKANLGNKYGHSGMGSDYRQGGGMGNRSPRGDDDEPNSRDNKFSGFSPAGPSGKKEAPSKASFQPTPSTSSGPKAKGMQLGKPKQQDDFVSAIAKEEKLQGTMNPALAFGAAAVPVAEAAPKDKVQIKVEEKIVLQLERDGGVKKLEIKGEMKLSIHDPDQARVVVRTSGSFKKEDGFVARLHPKIDKAAWDKSGLLGLKDASQRFPVGSDNAPVILKWRKVTTDDSEIPFTINFWPNNEDGRTVVSAEITHVKSAIPFKYVFVSIPCRAEPQVNSCDGDFKFNRNDGLVWRIEEISEDKPSANLEFSVPEVDGDSFFPLHISLYSSELYSNLKVEEIVDAQSQTPVDFHQDVSLSTEEFTVE